MYCYFLCSVSLSLSKLESPEKHTLLRFNFNESFSGLCFVSPSRLFSLKCQRRRKLLCTILMVNVVAISKDCRLLVAANFPSTLTVQVTAWEVDKVRWFDISGWRMRPIWSPGYAVSDKVLYHSILEPGTYFCLTLCHQPSTEMQTLYLFICLNSVLL